MIDATTEERVNQLRRLDEEARDDPDLNCDRGRFPKRSEVGARLLLIRGPVAG